MSRRAKILEMHLGGRQRREKSDAVDARAKAEMDFAIEYANEVDDYFKGDHIIGARVLRAAAQILHTREREDHRKAEDLRRRRNKLSPT